MFCIALGILLMMLIDNEVAGFFLAVGLMFVGYQLFCCGGGKKKKERSFREIKKDCPRTALLFFPDNPFLFTRFAQLFRNAGRKYKHTISWVYRLRCILQI